jgi:hypothetical protein
MKNSIAFFLILVSFLSCKKDEFAKPEPLPPLNITDTSGYLEIHVANTVNNAPLSLSTTSYVSSNNDTFTVDMLKYYISNIQLVTATGYTYTEAESYYLVNQSDPNSLHLMVKNVPSGSFTSINFTIGVDSLRNVTGSQTGALDPINDMFWTWNTGYIMAKMEGYSPQSNQATKKISFHIGGFKGIYNAVRKVSLPFPNSANVTTNHTPILSLNADLYKWFLNPNFSNFNTSSNISTTNLISKGIADNYASMFSVISVVN